MDEREDVGKSSQKHQSFLKGSKIKPIIVPFSQGRHFHVIIHKYDDVQKTSSLFWEGLVVFHTYCWKDVYRQ